MTKSNTLGKKAKRKVVIEDKYILTTAIQTLSTQVYRSTNLDYGYRFEIKYKIGIEILSKKLDSIKVNRIKTFPSKK